MTVEQLLIFLEDCRNRGMGNAIVVACDSNDEIFEIGFRAVVNVALDDDGELVEVLPPSGREAVIFW